MKKRLFLLPVILATTLLVGGCHYSPPASPPPPLPDSPLSMMYFSESASYYKHVQGYEFRAEEGAYTVYFHLANEEEPYAVQADQAWAETLTGFISQYGMMAWDGFKDNASGLLDGTQFSINFTFVDGTSVRASGYGSFPVNYGDASSAIETHFMQLLPQDMRTW